MSVEIIYRKPVKKDAKKIYNLVKSTQVLDINSEYLYLLQSTHFSDTCNVAIANELVVGFVSGYIHPKYKGVYFLWQVGVDANLKGKGLAKKLILDILKREELSHIKYLYTTISPSNKASKRVFEKVALELDCDIQSEKHFEIEDFNNAHEEEVLYKIGPFNKKQGEKFENI